MFTAKVFGAFGQLTLVLFTEIPIKRKMYFISLPTDMAITKKTTSAKPLAPAKKTTKPATKAVKSLVVTKTTKPRVVVETKSLSTASAVAAPMAGCCNGHEKKGWKAVFKVFFILLTIANFVLLCIALSAIKSQQHFQILNSGGEENYESRKNVYATPEYQSLMTAEIYRVIDNIHQSVTQNQPIQ
ncbi:MAG: hypothetical protein LBU27_00255 [Candidatus Peribacteria bacterium]|nr:hypothetical protein [Candidatus Peribacteria bacterium]